MKFTLKIWRQRSPNERGAFVSYPIENINPEMSMLECLDVLNETLIERGEEPVAFDHDCREGICGACGFMIRAAIISLTVTPSTPTSLEPSNGGNTCRRLI